VLYTRWIRVCVPSVNNVSGSFGTAGRVYIAPIQIPWRVEVDMIAYIIRGTSAGEVRVGLYKEGPTPDKPDGGELVVESDSVPQIGTYRFHKIPIPDTILEPGLYFICLQGSDPDGTFQYADPGTDPDGLMGWYYDHTYGPFENPCPATSISPGICPDMSIRVKRVLP